MNATEILSSEIAETLRRRGERQGDWLLTFTGRKFWPLAPRAEDVCIEDIAHHLANTCRFGGACRQFYSVAQHSIIVARHCSPENRFAGLLHDATEAYCGDMVRPMKRSFPEFKVIEEQIWRMAIAPAFGLPRFLDMQMSDPNISDPVARQIKLMDNRALITERRDLFLKFGDLWIEDAEGIQPFEDVTVARPWAPERAECEFLAAFEVLQESAERREA